jgi:hypothetical protein
VAPAKHMPLREALQEGMALPETATNHDFVEAL